MLEQRRALNIEAFVRPRSVAIIGGSRNRAALTARPGQYLSAHGFRGTVTIVHPSAEPAGPFDTVRQIADLPRGIEIALILLSADHVPDALEQCIAVGVENIVVLASNLRSADPLLEKTLALLRGHPEVRLLGPNCLGVIAPSGGTYLTFSGAVRLADPYHGPVALVTQSGAIGNAIMLNLLRRGVGINSWLSTGDEFDIGALEVACALAQNEQTSVIGMFLEGLTDIEFLPQLESAARLRGIHVVAVRGGTSELGKTAAFGHTGKIVGNAAISRQLLEEAGVILVDTIRDLCDTAALLAQFARSAPDGAADVAIVAPSGGIGVLAADAVAATRQVRLAPLDDRSRFSAELRATLGRATNDGGVTNPLDIPNVADPGAFTRSVGALRSSPGIDAVIGVVTELVNDLESLADNPPDGAAPLVLSGLSPSEPLSASARRSLGDRGVVVIDDVADAIRCIDRWVRGDPPAQPGTGWSAVRTAGVEQAGIIAANARFGDALAGWLIATVPVSSEAEALQTAARLGYPVAIKAEGSRIEHRAPIGAVRAGLRSPTEVSTAYRAVAEISARYGDRVVMQPCAAPGVELMLSAVRDSEAGCVVICRPGGRAAEDARRSAILGRWIPRWEAVIAASDAGEMLRRATIPADRLIGPAETLLEIIINDKELLQVECNPIIVPQDGIPKIVDVLAFITTRQQD